MVTVVTKHRTFRKITRFWDYWHGRCSTERYSQLKTFNIENSKFLRILFFYFSSILLFCAYKVYPAFEEARWETISYDQHVVFASAQVTEQTTAALYIYPYSVYNVKLIRYLVVITCFSSAAQLYNSLQFRILTNCSRHYWILINSIFIAQLYNSLQFRIFKILTNCSRHYWILINNIFIDLRKYKMFIAVMLLYKKNPTFLKYICI